MIPSKWSRVSNHGNHGNGGFPSLRHSDAKMMSAGVSAKDVVRKLLVVDPTKRMTVDEALQHPWLQVGELQVHHPPGALITRGPVGWPHG